MTKSNLSVCTLSLALAMALQPHTIAHAASHCKGLEEAVCNKMTACRWNPELRSTKWFDKSGAAQVRKAHCRLDVAAAAKLAAEIAAKADAQR